MMRDEFQEKGVGLYGKVIEVPKRWLASRTHKEDALKSHSEKYEKYKKRFEKKE